MTDLLGADGVICIPTAHDLPPFVGGGLEQLIEFREKTLALTCVASLARLPQLNIPATMVEGVPVGLSFIAGPRGEERLLAMAAALHAQLPAGRAA
jgi:amidase